jgi:hypothetical protein
MNKANAEKKSRMVRIVVSDDVWADFKLLHRGRYASKALGDLVEREVIKGRRTSLDVTPHLVEVAIRDAQEVKSELAELIARLERYAETERERGGWT